MYCIVDYTNAKRYDQKGLHIYRANIPSLYEAIGIRSFIPKEERQFYIICIDDKNLKPVINAHWICYDEPKDNFASQVVRWHTKWGDYKGGISLYDQAVLTIEAWTHKTHDNGLGPLDYWVPDDDNTVSNLWQALKEIHCVNKPVTYDHGLKRYVLKLTTGEYFTFKPRSNPMNNAVTIIDSIATTKIVVGETWESKKIRKILACLRHNQILYSVDHFPKSLHSREYWVIYTNDSLIPLKIYWPAGEPAEEGNETDMDEAEHCEPCEPTYNQMTFTERFKSDLEKVAYRQGVRRAINISHAMILYTAKAHLNFDNSKLLLLLEILESDFGKALMSWGLGEGLQKFKQDNQILQNLSEEFRVSGLDLGAEAGLEKLLGMSGDLLPMVASLANAIKVATTDGVDIVQAMGAWKAVDDSMPANVRVAMDNLTRIKSDQVNNITTEQAAEEEQQMFEAVVASSEQEEFAFCV